MRSLLCRKILTTKLQRGRIASAQPQWLRVVAMLCVALMGAIGTAQAVHIHGDWLPQNALHATVPADASQGQGEEHCPLCVAMHSAMPVTLAVVPLPLQTVQHLVSARVLVAPQKLWSFAMFSRPPPGRQRRSHHAGDRPIPCAVSRRQAERSIIL